MTQRSHWLRIESPELLLAQLGLAFGDHGLARGAQFPPRRFFFGVQSKNFVSFYHIALPKNRREK